jgi:hypothetical protein
MGRTAGESRCIAVKAVTHAACEPEWRAVRPTSWAAHGFGSVTVRVPGGASSRMSSGTPAARTSGERWPARLVATAAENRLNTFACPQWDPES